MLEEVLKELKKKAQQAIIGVSVGSSMNHKTNSNRQKVETEGEEKLSSLQTNMTDVSSHLGNSVKGQFGKQVKETFKKQQESLKQF